MCGNAKQAILVSQDTDKYLTLTREWCSVSTNTFLKECYTKKKAY